MIADLVCETEMKIHTEEDTYSTHEHMKVVRKAKGVVRINNRGTKAVNDDGWKSKIVIKVGQLARQNNVRTETHRNTETEVREGKRGDMRQHKR